jgi:hypothetical protein
MMKQNTQVITFGKNVQTFTPNDDLEDEFMNADLSSSSVTTVAPPSEAKKKFDLTKFQDQGEPVYTPKTTLKMEKEVITKPVAEQCEEWPDDDAPPVAINKPVELRVEKKTCLSKWSEPDDEPATTEKKSVPTATKMMTITNLSDLNKLKESKVVTNLASLSIPSKVDPVAPFVPTFKDPFDSRSNTLKNYKKRVVTRSCGPIPVISYEKGEIKENVEKVFFIREMKVVYPSKEDRVASK